MGSSHLFMFWRSVQAVSKVINATILSPQVMLACMRWKECLCKPAIFLFYSISQICWKVTFIHLFSCKRSETDIIMTCFKICLPVKYNALLMTINLKILLLEWYFSAVCNNYLFFRNHFISSTTMHKFYARNMKIILS
jgi:hypothetical protein